jgi:hypothetical protein
MWKKDEVSSTRHAERKLLARGKLLLFSLALLAAFGSVARAQHLPLPPQEQEWVNNAIERGVRFLKKNQHKSGTWPKRTNEHSVGYAALPALTLLECGVPPDDPLIQRAAHFVRSKRTSLATTYELSLSILFLDRLGDPNDKSLIQTYALRLVAGQTATGGWGYRCPLIGPNVQKELMTALRHLNPPDLVGKPAERRDLARKPDAKPEIARKPDERPDIARKPGAIPDLAAKEKKPDGLGRVDHKPGGHPLESTTTHQARPPLSGSVARGEPHSPEAVISKPGDTPSDSAIALSVKKAEKIDSTKPSTEQIPPLPQPAEQKPKDAKQGEATAKAAKAGGAKPAPAEKADKPYEVPERLHRLAVVQDPDLHVLADPAGRSKNDFLSTTDNSNTQFAILALWTAQRYDIPLDRTLKLIVRRYLTSQNPDGTWSYHYGFGGAPPSLRFSSPGAMTCVGLIGLAVGHGLANIKPGPTEKPVQDPRILNGFLALREMIDLPAGRMIDLPMQNLYYLWSLERVAVLYNLPMIGDRDWYRWGAEILVANQTREGNWEGGGYPAHHPTIDTCLALLFLKRANLVKDLTAKLPFNPADLNKDLMQRLVLAPEPTKPKPEPTTPPVETPESAPTEELISKPLSSATATEEAPTVSPNEHIGRTKWIILSFVVFLLLAGGSLYFVLAAMRQGGGEDTTKDAPKHKKLKGPKRKNRLSAIASSVEAKT